MKQIKVISGISTHLDKGFKKIATLEFNENDPKSGSFGHIYQCRSVNGIHIAKPLALKVLLKSVDQNFETVQKLQKKLAKKHKELEKQGTSLFDEYPALIAVPLYSFHGTLDDEDVYGYCAYDLNAMDYGEFKDQLILPSEQSVRAAFYSKKNLNNRLTIGYQLIRAFGLLSSFNFVHADIKEEAFFVGPDLNTMAIIDFDSGAFGKTKNGPYQTTTPGTKTTPWLAPEILRLIDGANSQQIKVTKEGDYWSVARAFYYILCGRDPFFFLNRITDSIVRTYLKDSEWPNVNMEKEYFNDAHKNQVLSFSKYYNKEVPSTIKEAFEETFNKGYFDTSKRYSFVRWLQAFEQMSSPPVIEFFEPNVYELEDQEEVVFTWSVKDAVKIFIEDKLVGNSKEFRITPKTNTKVTLMAVNSFGAYTTKTVSITVNLTPPEILSFSKNKPARLDHEPVVLSWKVLRASKLLLNPGKIDVTETQSYEAFPKKDTTYTLQAISIFGTSSMAEINVQVSKVRPSFIEIKADPLERTDLKPVTLSWSTKNAKKVVLNPGDIKLGPKDSKDVFPKSDTTYELTAFSLFGVKHSETIEITTSKKRPEIILFDCNPGIRTDANPLQLTWEVKGAADVVLMPDGKRLKSQGTLSVYPKKDTVYSLKATSLFGVSQQQSLQVLVSKEPPTIQYIKRSSKTRKDQNPITVQWETSEASQVVILPDNKKLETKGALELFPTKDTKYTLVATSLFGIESKETFKLKVSRIGPKVTMFSLVRPLIRSGQSTLLIWEVSEAEKLWIDGKEISIYKGQKQYTPKESRDFVLIAENHFGFQTQVTKKLVVLKPRVHIMSRIANQKN